MFIISNFITAVAYVADYALEIYLWVIIARAVISWVSPDPYNPIVAFLRKVTDPLLYRIRTWLPVDFGGIDLSPIVAVLGIIFLQRFVVASLYGIARMM